uniref:Uncharacterized protein n=1 Tax=Timema douglasi TaxID=61478 RepID=A0A7R8VBW0_TIMDO|nr:unnamed protein product [Timema douglasi]
MFWYQAFTTKEVLTQVEHENGFEMSFLNKNGGSALCLAGDVTPVLPPPTSGTKAAALSSKNWDSPYYIALVSGTATPLKSRPLTVHQKEMMRKRRDDIPAMYMDLTQDTQTQFTEESQSQDCHGVTSNSSSIESLENKELPLSSLKMHSTPDINENKAVSLSKDNEDQDHGNKSKSLYGIKKDPEKEENAISEINDDPEAHSKGNDMEVFDCNKKKSSSNKNKDKTPPKTCSGDDSVTPETSPGQSFPSFASPRSRALMSSMKLMSPSCLSLIKRNNIRTNSNRSAQILDMTRALDVDNPKSDISHDKLDLDNSSAEHRENESLASRLMKKKKIALPAKDRLLMYSSGGRLLELDYTRHNYSADASPSSSNLKRRLEEEEAEQTCSPPKKKRVSFTDPPRSLELHFNQTLAEMSLRHRSFSEKEMPTMIKRRLGFISRRLADNLMNYEDEPEETPTNKASVPSQVNQLDNNSNNVDSEDLSQGSVVETLSTQFNDVDSIYPSLIHCQHPIESLVPLLVEPMWTNQLTKTFHNRLISTVGDLALQTEAIVNTFPLKEPKIQRVRTKLQEYEKEFMEINERKVQVTTEISGIEMLPTTLKQVTSVSSPCKSDDSVEEMCGQILQKKSANEALKIMLDQISGSNNTDEFTSLPPGVGDVIAERWSISAVMSHYLDRAKKYPSPSTSQLKQEINLALIGFVNS